MLKLGIEKVRELGYKGITVEGNYKFYNKVGFQTSSEYNIFPTGGIPCLLYTSDAADEG